MLCLWLNFPGKEEGKKIFKTIGKRIIESLTKVDLFQQHVNGITFAASLVEAAEDQQQQHPQVRPTTGEQKTFINGPVFSLRGMHRVGPAQWDQNPNQLSSTAPCLVVILLTRDMGDLFDLVCELINYSDPWVLNPHLAKANSSHERCIPTDKK